MPLTTTSATRQLSDGNFLNGGPGNVFGQSAADGIGFYGVASGIVQPSGQNQVAINRGNAAGVVATIYSASQSPSSVANITTAEKTMTLVTAAGSVFQVTTTDLLFVNKITSQAGLGVGNVRCSAANTAAVTFSNVTGATLTPTASQSYAVVALRGFNTFTGTLSPAAVPASSIIEQQFAVAGARAGELLQVNKPTSQAGLDIVGCRVVSSGTVGINFLNATAAAITPTAAEVYTFASLNGISAVNNESVVQSLQSPGSIAANSAAEQALTVTGLLATDIVKGISKPTAQTGLAVGTNMRISAANTLQLGFGNFTAGALTPTTSETYSVDVFRMNPVAPLFVTTATLTPIGVAGTTTAEQTFSVNGLVASSPVWVNKPSAQAGLGVAGCRISGAGTLAINFVNMTTGTIVPNAEVYTIGNFQLPYGDASSTWLQTASVADVQQDQLAGALRSALVNLGLVAGA